MEKIQANSGKKKDSLSQERQMALQQTILSVCKVLGMGALWTTSQNLHTVSLYFVQLEPDQSQVLKNLKFILAKEGRKSPRL